MRKVVSIFLMLVVLASTLGITINQHYCRGKLKSVGIWSGKKQCCKESDSNHEETFMGKCCHNLSHFSKLNSGFQPIIVSVDLSPKNLITSLPVFCLPSLTSGTHFSFFNDLRPPPLIRITLLFIQSFRI